MVLTFLENRRDTTEYNSDFEVRKSLGDMIMAQPCNFMIR